MTSTLSLIRDDVGKLETLSDLCALAHHTTLDSNRPYLVDGGLLATHDPLVNQHHNLGLSTIGSNSYSRDERLDSSATLVSQLTKCMEHDEAFPALPDGGRALDVAAAARSGKPDGAVQQEARIKRPMNPFMIWAKGERPVILGQNPTMHNSDVSRQLGLSWRAMSCEEKQPYLLAADRLADEHRRMHPNYKYRPRKKDPNCPRKRGRRLDSEALNRVAKALTKQEISACVSGSMASCGGGVKRTAAAPAPSVATRPSSVPLDPYYEYPAYQPAVDAAADHLERVAIVAASAPVTPIREEYCLLSHETATAGARPRSRRSGGGSVRPSSISERGWYSCPPSPSSYSDTLYPSAPPSAMAVPLIETPITEGFSSPPPLVDCAQYQQPAAAMSAVSSCPPLMNNTEHHAGGSLQQHRSSFGRQTPPLLSYCTSQSHHQQQQQDQPPQQQHQQQYHHQQQHQYQQPYQHPYPQQRQQCQPIRQDEPYRFKTEPEVESYHQGHLTHSQDPAVVLHRPPPQHPPPPPRPSSSPVFQPLAQHSPPRLEHAVRASPPHDDRHLHQQHQAYKALAASQQLAGAPQYETPPSSRSSQVSSLATKILTAIMVQQADDESSGSGAAPTDDSPYPPPPQSLSAATDPAYAATESQLGSPPLCRSPADAVIGGAALPYQGHHGLVNGQQPHAYQQPSHFQHWPVPTAPPPVASPSSHRSSHQYHYSD